MKCSKQNLINIVERASTISERLGPKFTFDDQTGKALINQRLKKWCEAVAKGDQQKFEKRLAWDNLTIQTICGALGTVRLVDDRCLPDWAETLAEVLQAASPEILEESHLHRCPYLDAEKPLPFEEVLIPFVEVAKRRLSNQASADYQQFSKAAQAQLERSLLEKLAGLCAFALELEFSIFRSYHDSPLGRFIGQLQTDPPRQQYTTFIKNLLNDGLLAFFQEYSVLARLAAIAVDFWVDATQEFLQRLASDRNQIQAAFQPQGELGQVVTTETGLSDPHNSGRSVIIITFASGLKLVYKPKSLGLEYAYFEFLTWLNDEGISLPLQRLKVLNQTTHGWMEFAQAAPCEDEQALQRFYRRAGMILCLVYVLRGTDCHSENLIACGEQPVLVDLETLLHHRTWAPIADADAQTLANVWLQDSVAGTALLPGWQLVPYGQGEGLKIDLSGLGGYGEQEIPFRALKWRCVNTDSMAIGSEQVRLKPKQNRPFGEEIHASLSDYSEEIVAGFRQMHHFLCQRKQVLLAADSPLAAFAHQKTRLVFRNTSVYFSILSKSLEPKCLRDGADHSIEFDVLSRAFLYSEDKHHFWSLLKAEQQALEQLDIPFFTACSDSDALTASPTQLIEHFLDQPSYEDVVARIQELGEADLVEQIRVIQGSIYASIDSNRHQSFLSDWASPEVEAIQPLSREALEQQAIAIAQDLQRHSIQAPDGSITWIGMAHVADAERFQLTPADHSLYNGRCGIALFLAAVAKMTGNSDFSQLALGAVRSLHQTLNDPNIESHRVIEQLGGSSAAELGAIVYALVQTAQFLDETSLLEDAQRVRHLIGQAAIITESQPGLMTGSAGAILGLLSLYKATVDPEVLKQAIAWGKQLLNLRVNSDAGYRTWLTQDGTPLVGLSNGVAGIAYALLQLYAVTQDVVFLSAAEEALAYERIVLSLATDRADGFNLLANEFPVMSWCYGVSGLGLARLGSLAVLDTDELRREIAAILQMLSSGLRNVDSLCCGNFGTIEALLVAAQHHPPLLEIVHRQTAWVMAQAKQAQTFRLLPNLPAEVFNPGFFQGIAGIGYGLLRVANPTQFPSVLLWQ